MTVIQSLTSRYSRRRFACLFLSLVVTLVAAPVLAALGFNTGYMEIFLALNVLAAVLITTFSFWSYLGLGLLVLLIVARGAYALLGYGTLMMTGQGVATLTCLISILIIFRFILSEGTVTSERIYAALDAYLMIGLMCGLLFFIFEEKWHGSLSIQGSSSPGSKQNLLAHTIYFSFVTLGTLGYGDITPISGPVRALAVAEAICGQMYLVVVVARLVSLYQEHTARNDRDSRNDTVDILGDPRSRRS